MGTISSDIRDRASCINRFKESARHYKELHGDSKNLSSHLEPKERKNVLQKVLDLHVNFKVAEVQIGDHFKTQMNWHLFDNDKAEWKHYDLLKRSGQLHEEDQRQRATVCGQQESKREIV